MLNKTLAVYLLAYPDNPVGQVFLNTFLRKNISVKGIVVEEKKMDNNLKRFKRKLYGDGLLRSVFRFMQLLVLRITKQRIVDIAEQNNIPVYRVQKFNSKECENLLAGFNMDILAIASAPILKDYIFNKARRGCLNAHPGWLPAYRGLGGNAFAIQDQRLPGVTVHFIDASVDRGQLIVREHIEIKKRDTVAKINDRAIQRGAELMADVIQDIQDDKLDIPKINDKLGKVYKVMPFEAVKKLNKKLHNPTFVESLN